MSGKTVSARFDEEVVEELEWLKRDLGITKTTDILVAAIHFFYRNARKSSKNQTAFDYLEESGFIGSLKGKPHFSSEYKQLLTDSLKEKHGQKS